MKMAVPLSTIRYAAQTAGAALIVAHHWNKSGDGTDRKRFTGSGTAEWGRVLLSMSVIRRTTEDPDGVQRSIVDLKLEAIGDEIADIDQTFRRKVWTDNPTDLGSPMHYSIEPVELDPAHRGSGSEYNAANAAKEDVRAFFLAHPDETTPSLAQLYARLRQCGYQHEDNAIKNGANDLVSDGILISGSLGRRAVSNTLAPTEGPNP